MIERLTLVNHNGDHYLSKSMNGEFVRHSDYEALEAQCRELEESYRLCATDNYRLSNSVEHYLEGCKIAQAHAQKLTEALKDLCAAYASCNGEDHPAYKKAGKALSLTPTSALAAVRDEVREECAMIAECHFDDRGNGRSGHHSEMDWTDGYKDATKGSAAAIRAKKEAGV